ncbi:hypothetical protein Bca52824_019079 [Brassica carinata]|uniref:Uncharacterized protein n=1 Tax=Brassica carinata TaxID=52824 RepID=A0A8X8B021_BRACI|nr:hypothetical protein Bca52824_019079 [Brassica carinata]
MSIADETGGSVCLFRWSDDESSRHGRPMKLAIFWYAGDGVNPEETQAAPFMSDMVGKTYTFQVRVSSLNSTANHQTFTVGLILNEREPQPAFVDDGGDDDNGDDSPGALSVPAKVEAGGSSQAQGASDKVKKVRKA